MRRLAFVLLALASCSSPKQDAPEPDAGTTCEPGWVSDGTKCVPHLDECGDAAISKLGGGCTNVGVPKDGCGPGFSSDGHGACDPVLPKAPCVAGTMAVPGDVTCRTVGIAKCATGFASDGKGGCDVLLPPKPCASGAMAVPGEITCREVAPCGADPFGDLPPGATTFGAYVDASYAGSLPSDGSHDRPFKTLGEAVDAASATVESTIAIAAGTYVENLDIAKPVHLWGRCPRMVTVRGVGTKPTLTFRRAGSAHRLAIEGTGMGVDAPEALANVTLDRLWIHDLGEFAVHSASSASVVMRGVSVERATIAALVVAGGTLDVEASVVRETRPRTSDSLAGRAISAELRDGIGSKLSLKRTVVEANVESGITSFGSEITIDASVIRDTKANEKHLGRGINAYGTTLTVRDTLFERNVDAGVAVFGGVTTMERCVVRDTLPNEEIAEFGIGVVALLDGVKKASLTLRDSVLERNRSSGVYVDSSSAVLEGVLIRDTLVRASDGNLGTGVTVDSSKLTAELTVRRSLFERNVLAAVLSGGSTVTIEESVLRESLAAAPTVVGATGILALPSPSGKKSTKLTLARSIVERNEGSGVLVYGSTADIDATLVRDTRPYPSTSEQGNGIAVVRDEKTGFETSLVLRRSVLESNTTFGLLVLGTNAEVESSVIRGTHAQPSNGVAGVGISAIYADDGTKATLVLRTSTVEKNFEANVSVVGSIAKIESSILRNALASASGKYGDGLFVWSQPRAEGAVLIGKADVSGSLFAGNPRGGLATFGAELTLASSIARCNGFDLDNEPLEVGDGMLSPVLVDGGGNWCGCGVGWNACRAGSAGLAPIPLPPKPKAP